MKLDPAGLVGEGEILDVQSGDVGTLLHQGSEGLRCRLEGVDGGIGKKPEKLSRRAALVRANVERDPEIGNEIDNVLKEAFVEKTTHGGSAGDTGRPVRIDCHRGAPTCPNQVPRSTENEL